jgi:hypothetical protein
LNPQSAIGRKVFSLDFKFNGIVWPGLLLLLVVLLMGCASVGDGEPFDKVITRDTDLTRTGSADSVTERRLEAGVRIRVTGQSGDGKLEVETLSGDKGYVDQDAVGDPPPPDIRNENGN